MQGLQVAGAEALGEPGLATLRLPDGSSRFVPVYEGAAHYRGERAGMHLLDAEPGREPLEFAASLLEPEETQQPPRPTLRLGARELSPPLPCPGGRLRFEAWFYLLGAALALLGLELYLTLRPSRALRRVSSVGGVARTRAPREERA